MSSSNIYKIQKFTSFLSFGWSDSTIISGYFEFQFIENQIIDFEFSCNWVLRAEFWLFESQVAQTSTNK